MKELVIDVSHIDANIDIAEWKRRRGIWAVIVKCGGYENIGNGRYEQFQTRIFPRHYEATKAAGLHCGAYYYSVATDVATMRANADHCASLLKGRSFDMPIYIDIEDRRQLALPKRQLTDLALAFILRMRELGYNAGLYTSRSVINDQMFGSELEPYPLWIAEYSDRCRTDLAHGMWQFGAMNIDGDVYWGDKSGYVDANWCYVDYTSGKPSDEGGSMAKLTYPQMAAEVCEHFIDHPVHGYSQINRDGVGSETITLSDGTEVSFSAGDRDCSRLMQTCYVVIGVLPRGLHVWTGNQREIMLANGFVEVSLNDVQRGDVLWRTKHTEMYLGNGVEGGARRSETGGIDGATGDQDGLEITKSAYVKSHWTSAYRCTKVRPNSGGGESVAPKQKTTNPKNDIGIKYRAHVSKAGWLASVRDGQDAGTEGYAVSIEALKITPPEGIVLDAYAHIQGIGNLYYDGIMKGASSGTGSSANDPIIGTTGQAKRMEALRLVVTKWPDSLKGKKLRYQGHVQGIGWMDPVSEGQWCGTRGQKKRLECVRIWFE